MAACSTKDSSRPLYSSTLVSGRGGGRPAGEPGATVTPVASTGTRGLRGNRDPCQSARTRAVQKRGNTEELLSRGFELLRKRQWDRAVKVFQSVNPETHKQREGRVNGLARALHSLPGRAEEALHLLQQLPPPVQTSTLLTTSRALQALKRFNEAEDLLKQIIKKEGGDLEQGRACKNHV